MMKPTALMEHPEGGRFQEVFRSAYEITHQSGSRRSALTHIYFSLNSGEVSRFHRVSSDEVWNLYQGTGLHLFTWDGSDNLPEQVTLSAKENCFCHVIPAGTWQAANPISGKILVGCSVAPGFDFADFELMDPNSEAAALLIRQSAEMARFVHPEG